MEVRWAGVPKRAVANLVQHHRVGPKAFGDEGRKLSLDNSGFKGDVLVQHVFVELKDSQPASDRTVVVSVGQMNVRAEKHGHAPGDINRRLVLPGNTDVLAADHLLEQVGRQPVGELVADFVGYQQLLVVFALEPKSYLVVGIEHAHGAWGKHPFDDRQHGALARACVALDQRRNVVIVEPLDPVKQPADERQEVQIHLPLTQLVLHHVVKQRRVGCVPGEGAANTVPGNGLTTVRDVVGDNVDHAVVKAYPV